MFSKLLMIYVENKEKKTTFRTYLELVEKSGKCCNCETSVEVDAI